MVKLIDLDTLGALLESKKSILVCAGAGTGVELGLDTYWTGSHSTYGDQETKYGFTALEHANGALWRSHPDEQAAYYRDRFLEFNSRLNVSTENLYTRLLEYFTRRGKDYFVVTSNIDNAFLHYGFREDRVYEVHGNHTFAQCVIHGIVPYTGEKYCECGSFWRPNILLFNDSDFHVGRVHNQRWEYSVWLEQKMDDRANNVADLLILEIGVGTTVPRVRDMATEAYYLMDQPLVHVNLMVDADSDYKKLFHPVLPTAWEAWVLSSGEDLGLMVSGL